MYMYVCVFKIYTHINQHLSKTLLFFFNLHNFYFQICCTHPKNTSELIFANSMKIIYFPVS